MDAAGAIAGGARIGENRSAPGNAFSELSSEQFVRIIFTELSSQDPLEPSDSNALLQQLSTIRSIQSDIDMSKRLETLVGQNQFASAGGLIGQFVSGLTEENDRAEGLVLSVSRTAKGPVLNLDSGQRVPFDRLDEVADGTLFS